MTASGITWSQEVTRDDALVVSLPTELRDLLAEHDGFILHHGALHVRGAAGSPDWHSLRTVLSGELALHSFYDSVLESDIPFAEDQLGDQYLLRDGTVHHLEAETGTITQFASSLAEFMAGVSTDIEDYLNVGLEHRLEPGQLLHAFPPFCTAESGSASLKAISAREVILFHADLAAQLRDIPDGGRIVFRTTS